MANSLRPQESQHARPPCPSPTPGVYLNSCPLNQWCYPAILSSHLLPLLPSTFPSIRVFSNELAICIRWPQFWSFSFSISPSTEYSGLISLGLTGWISLQSKGLSRVFSGSRREKLKWSPRESLKKRENDRIEVKVVIICRESTGEQRTLWKRALENFRGLLKYSAELWSEHSCEERAQG